jgi:hypothetical protein
MQKDLFDLWWEWAEKPRESILMIHGDIHYPVMELSPEDRRDRAKVNEAVRDAQIKRTDRTVHMSVYCAANCDTEVACDVEDIGCGAGIIKCLECGGDGNWGKFAPEIVGPDCPCVECKGTGYRLISI